MTTKKDASTTAEKLQTKRVPGVPFTPGDPRINTAGRKPGSGDPLKEIAKRIAESRIKTGLTKKQQRQLKQLGIEEEGISVIESIMIDWATSSNVAKQERFAERYAGKVPNVNQNTNTNFDVMKYVDKFTDAELQAIKEGADGLEILIGKIDGVTASDFVSAIKADIEWHKNNRHEKSAMGKTEDWKDGFIEGMRQTLKLWENMNNE